MSCRPFVQLRAFILLIALGLGLVTQSVVLMAGPVRPPGRPVLSTAVEDLRSCLDCKGSLSSTTMAPTCASAPCVLGLGILSTAFVIELDSDVKFGLSPYTIGRGVSVRPDLAPPRATFHS